MNKNTIKALLRQFTVSVVAFGAVILFAGVVSAQTYTGTWTPPTQSFPNGNAVLPTGGNAAPANCDGNGQVLQTNSSGTIVCGTVTYQ